MLAIIRKFNHRTAVVRVKPPNYMILSVITTSVLLVIRTYWTLLRISDKYAGRRRGGAGEGMLGGMLGRVKQEE